MESFHDKDDIRSTNSANDDTWTDWNDLSNIVTEEPDSREKCDNCK